MTAELMQSLASEFQCSQENQLMASDDFPLSREDALETIQ
jgi:hypothetical protein